MTGAEIVGLVGLVLLLLAAAFLALAETALTHLSRTKALALAEEGRRGASSLVRLLEHRERVLNPILLLGIVCQLGAATIMALLAQNRFGATGIVVAAVALVVVVFVAAEAAPKSYALLHPERAALLAAPLVGALGALAPVRLVTRLLIGVANVLVPGRERPPSPGVSEEELLALADVAVEEEVIEVEERALIESIIEFGDTVAREVMVPRPDMVTLPADTTVEAALETSMTRGYSRIPVLEEGIDDVAGIVYAKDLMRAVRDGRGGEPVRVVLREAAFVPETKKVAELMREMQARSFHMAVVVDEYGGTAGLVTLEDLIEELVGEIVDEFDVEDPLVEPLPGGDVRVNARMPIDELEELLGLELPDGDWDTVGGLVYNLLGHVPHEGETVELDGNRFRAERVQGRRIGRVRITRTPPTAAPAS